MCTFHDAVRRRYRRTRVPAIRDAREEPDSRCASSGPERNGVGTRDHGLNTPSAFNPWYGRASSRVYFRKPARPWISAAATVSPLRGPDEIRTIGILPTEVSPR